MSESPLVEFLLARIAEVELLAGGIEGVTYRPRWITRPEGDVLVASAGLCPKALLLAECEAKRRIIEEHAPGDVDPCTSADHMGHLSPASECPVFRELAAVYADHPDYREEWRP